MKRPYPRKLSRDPIVEAIAEFRYSLAGQSGSGKLMLGYLYSRLKEKFGKLEDLPASQFPSQLKAIDPNLSYVPEYRLVGQEGMLLVSDRSVAVAAATPYPGWNEFKRLVLDVWNCMRESGLVGTAERVSVKYVNLIESPPAQDHIRLVDIRLSIGQKTLTAEPIMIRTEFTRDRQTRILQLVSQAISQKSGTSETRNGLVVDIDSIYMGPFDDFWGEAESLLELVHRDEKDLFFELLTEETVRDYGPEF